MKKKAFKAAFPYTLPICVGFLFLGMSYGFMMRSKGFSFVYPLCMSFFIYAGSMEFVTANLLLSAFNPVYAFFLTLMVNARHLFYGISMLEKYKNTGWKKFYLIFGMCDESFTVNCTVDPPEDVDRGWFMFFVNALNQFYWVTGATAGALLGYVIHFNTKGIDSDKIELDTSNGSIIATIIGKEKDFRIESGTSNGNDNISGRGNSSASKSLSAYTSNGNINVYFDDEYTVAKGLQEMLD